MKLKKIINIVGARPNFMKIAPIVETFQGVSQVEQMLVHTGQHYDAKMSKLFFEELELPEPNVNLQVGSASHAVQTSEIMRKIEPVLLDYKPDYILVVGDVNSTIACALTASKLGIKVIHVEAGLRSYDRAMPEEINRVLTDSLSDLLFTTERSANANLLREGIASEKIFFVGNVMIDTLKKNVKKARASTILSQLSLEFDDLQADRQKLPMPYAVLTLHRPSNVDNRETASSIFEALSLVSMNLPILFPIHPRTKKRLLEFGFDRGRQYAITDLAKLRPTSPLEKGVFLIDPLGYLDFLQLMSNAALVLTDSGGIQEETTVLGVPCVTLRENTERPVTITEGTNHLVGTQRDKIVEESMKILHGKVLKGKIPELWDGKTAERIVNIVLNYV